MKKKFQLLFWINSVCQVFLLVQFSMPIWYVMLSLTTRGSLAVLLGATSFCTQKLPCELSTRDFNNLIKHLVIAHKLLSLPGEAVDKCCCHVMFCASCSMYRQQTCHLYIIMSLKYLQLLRISGSCSTAFIGHISSASDWK